MKISVILPTYKPQSYLWECLDSLANQTLNSDAYEVIIILNGCNEPYKSQISAFIEQYNSIHWGLYQTDFPGVSNARNMAIDLAQGDYITFIDDDDYISHDCLRLLLECADLNTISICNPWMFNDGKSTIRLDNKLKDIYDNCPKGVKLPYMHACSFFSGPCMKLFPAQYLKGNYFDTRFKNGEDTIYMFLISKSFRYVSFTSNDAIYYRRYRVGSAMTTRRSYWKNLKNNVNEFATYIKYYLSAPMCYNLKLFMLRCLSSLFCAVFNKQ